MIEEWSFGSGVLQEELIWTEVWFGDAPGAFPCSGVERKREALLNRPWLSPSVRTAPTLGSGRHTNTQVEGLTATAVQTQQPGLAGRPHMAAAGAAAVRNVRHVFTLCCEKRSRDALLSLEGRSDHVCLPHGAHHRDVYVLLHVQQFGLAGIWDALRRPSPQPVTITLHCFGLFTFLKTSCSRSSLSLRYQTGRSFFF